MLKRIFLVSFLVVGGTVVFLLLWQPASLKTKLANYVSENISKNLPYDVSIGRASGNVVTGLVFHDVRLLKKHTHRQLLQIEKVSIGVKWTALILHKTVQINRLEIDLAGGTAVIKGDLVLKPVLAGQFEMKDQNFPFGQFLPLAMDQPPQIPLRHSGRWKISKNAYQINIETDGALENGPLKLRGLWTTQGYYQGYINWIHIPLTRLLPAPPPAGLETASLELKGSGKGMRLTGAGHLTSKFVTANIRLVNGAGTFQAIGGPAGMRTHVSGDLDLARRSMTGSGSLEHAVWKDKQIEKIDYTFKVDPRRQNFTLTAANLQMHAPSSGPSDIENLQIAATGLSPRWQTTASVKWKDGSSLQTSGYWEQGTTFRRYVWNRLVFASHLGGSWTAQREGSFTMRGRDKYFIRQLILANGHQTLQMPEAAMVADRYKVQLMAHELDPDPWAKFLMPGARMKGALNTSLQISGTRSDMVANGYLNGHFSNFSVDSLGLALKDLDIDIRASQRQLEIRRFTGKTKKGDIQLTGGSRLPNLNFNLHMHRFPLQPIPPLKAVADADLHVAGTAQSPALLGQITLTEATYTVPKKKDKSAKAAEQPFSLKGAGASYPDSSVDLALKWPRNGWYRDGVTSIETRGDLRIQKTKGSGDLLLTGTISSLRGVYNYMGRNLNIDSCQIQFVGSPELNPNLNIEASYASGATTAYLDITGTLQQPILKLRSNPPLPQQDIISVMIFGQPLSELRSRSGDTASNQEVMQAAGSVMGGYLAKSLNETGIPLLNFDMLNIQPADQGGSEVTVGRYLTRKLFVSYGQTVRGTSERSLKADYFLTDKWVLQGTSDSLEGYYMDFLFRYPLNKRGMAANNSPIPRSPFRQSLDRPGFQQPYRSPLQ